MVVAAHDQAIADHVARWCAALSIRPQLESDPLAVRRMWSRADVVVIDSDMARRLSERRPPRRDRLLLVHGDASHDEFWPQAVLLGAVAVASIRDEAAAVRALAATLDGHREACVVSIVGASGGVGASAVAAVLSWQARALGWRPAVIDADPIGGGVDLALGSERAPGLRWPELVADGSPWASRSLSDALPVIGGVSVLGPERDGFGSSTRGLDSAVSLPVLDAVTTATRAFDLVVVDLPRDRLLHEPAVVAESQLTVLIVADDLASVASARLILPWLRQRSCATVVVCADRHGGGGPRELADLLGHPVVGRWRRSRRLHESVEAGLGPRPGRSQRRLATTLLDLVGLGEGRS